MFKFRFVLLFFELLEFAGELFEFVFVATVLDYLLELVLKLKSR
jgi:hypothetical protein